MHKAYPWEKLKNVGDVFITTSGILAVRQASLHWGKRHKMKLKAHKIRNGSLVVRIG